MNKNLKASEFEKQGPYPFGGFGLARAWEKLRFIYRTGQNPDTSTDVNASPDQFPRETK